MQSPDTFSGRLDSTGAIPPPSHDASLRPAVLNPGRLLQEMAASFRLEAASKGLEFKLGPCSGWHDVVIDDAIVREIVGNLLRHAIEHTSAGWVRLAVTPPDGAHWSITVENSGDGIGPEQKPRVFPPSGGAPAPASALEASKQLAERLHGTISLSRASGRGSRFQVRLPVMVWG